MKSSSTSSSISLTKPKPKVTAGTVVALPTPTPTIGNRTRSRRSSSVFSVDTNKADFLPLSDTHESCSRSRYDLYSSHPSLSRTIKPLRNLRGTSDVSCARALAQVLLSGITDVVHLMQVPQEIRNDVEYMENTQAVSFMIQQLGKEVERLVSFRGLQETHAVVRIIDIAELTLAALSRLLGLTERLVKPLPSIPAGSDEEENSTEGSADRSAARMSLAQITTEALELPSSSHRPSSAPASDNASLKTNSTSRTATILTILHKARENGLGSLFRHKHETIENEVIQEDTSPHYSPRHSALYYPVDPLHPDVDIELPPMSQDAMNIVLSHDNTQMIKSSPTAIVRLLTSKNAIQDPNLIHWFFTSFRYVLLPSEVLHLLICRFDEPMPDVQMTRRQMRVWCNNQHKIVRPRVVSLLIRWIAQYWEPPYDDICVLNDMQDFVLKQVSASLLPDSLGIAFAQAIKGVRVDGATRATWLQNRLKGKSSNRPISASFAFNGDDTIRFPLDAFDCPAGYNALAEQLTRLEVELYGQLPSHALIRTWLKGKTEACAGRLTGTLSEMRVRHEAIGVKLTKLLQQAEGSSNRTLIETLRFQQMDLLKESSRLAMKIHAYEVVEKEIESSKRVATQAATAARDFDRSLNMLVLHTIIMDSKDKDSIIRAVQFWFNVAVMCLELSNINCAWTIYWAATNSQVVGRIFSILPSFDSETQGMYHALDAAFNANLHKTDETHDSTASIPRFQYVDKNITHIANVQSPLMENNIIHTQNLRIIGKVISLIESTRLYALNKDSAVEALLRRHISRFNVSNEVAHMNQFFARSEELRPRGSRQPTSPRHNSTPLSPPPSPKSSR